MRSAAAILPIGLAVVLSGAGLTAGSEVTWVPAHELAPSELGGRLAAGDLDADGDDDLPSDLHLYWNVGCPGPPVWQLEEDVLPYLPGCGLNSTTFGDCDADGDLDLIYGCFYCCSLRMFWNVGTPEEPEWSYGGPIAGDPSGGYIAYFCLADIDADGDLDLVGHSSSGATGIIENTGTPEEPYWVWLGLIPDVGPGGSDGVMAIGDLDGDTDLDIICGNPGSRVKCWENTGTLQAWSYERNDAMLTGVDEPTDGVFGIALPDVDCDGDRDLVIVGWWGEMYLYLNEQITPVRANSWASIKALYR